MKRDELLKLHEEVTAKGRDLMGRKNADYAEPDEVFGNLNVCEQLTICSTELGICVRLGDKLRRLISASKRSLEVTDESAEDTAIDIINYAVLWIAKQRSRTLQHGDRINLLIKGERPV